MDWMNDTKCNIDKCLRKFKDSKGDVSRWCGVVGDEDLSLIKPCDKSCPLYCDKFFCYQSKRIIKRHENTSWVSTNIMNEEYRNIYNIKAPDVKFSGLSRDGRAEQQDENAFNDKHHNTDNIVCPHCDYEIDDVWDYVGSSYSDYVDIDCPECEREFQATIHREVTFSTNR